MTLLSARPSPLFRARVAGLLYLLLFPAPFALLYVPARLIVPGDAGVTVKNIMASEALFRLGIAINLLTPIVMILVVLALYGLLKVVGTSAAMLMVMFVVAAVPIAMLSELTQLAALQLLSGADYLKTFTVDQVPALVMLLLDVHKQGINIAHIFWGLWLLPLSYLVFKSRFLPKILGVLLIVGCFGYVMQSFAALLVPNFKSNIIFFTSWGELFFPMWLLIKGVNVEQWERRVRQPA